MDVLIDQNTNTVSFFTPLKLRRRGGHRMVVLPDDAKITEIEPELDQKLLKGLIRAISWERQLRSGKVTLKELTEREGVSGRYIQHILRLNFLGPEIKEAILEGRQPEGLRLENMRTSVPLLWEEQRRVFNVYSWPHP